MMQVLGDVAQLGEIGKSPHHQHRSVVAQAAQHGLEHRTRLLIAIAAEADGGVANAFNQVECFVALLLAQRIAEQAAEKPNVLFERKIFVDSLIETVAGIHSTSETVDFLRCLPTAGPVSWLDYAETVSRVSPTR